MIMWETIVCRGVLPWEAEFERSGQRNDEDECREFLRAELIDGKTRPSLPDAAKDAAPPGVVQLIEKCWSEDKGRRPEFAEVATAFEELGKYVGLWELREGCGSKLRELIVKNTPLNARLDDKGRTMLLIAAGDGYLAVMSALLAAGVEVDKAEYDGGTPLYIAAEKGHEVVIRALLKAGAAVDQAKDTGATPLFVAAQEGHEAVVGALLKAGAAVDQANDTGATPLFIAAENGHEAVVGALLAAGAAVFKARDDGETPLFVAAYNGHDAVVKALLAAGVEAYQVVSACRVVVSIDLGTARTGYAFAFLDNPGLIFLGQFSGASDSFGDNARTTYFNDAVEGNTSKMLFQNFTIELEGEPADLLTKKIKDLNGKEHSLKSVFVKTLRYVKEEALKHVSEHVLGTITTADVYWVLTIPATWKDNAKSFLHTCTFEAGLISERNSQSLALALKPEAACLSIESNRSFLATGDKLVVLDCGSGTVEITTHMVRSKDPFVLEEIAMPDSVDWGSTHVDRNFEVFLEELITTPHFTALRKTPYYVDLMKSWRGVKISFMADEITPRSINLALIVEALPDAEIDIKERIDTHNHNHGKELKLRGRSILLIPPKLIKEFHEQVFKKIITEVLFNLSKNAHKPKYIFIIGGFSESDLMQKEFKAMLETPTRKVIIPRPRPSLAFMGGGVHFGVSRIAFVSHKLRNLCEQQI